MSAFTPLAISVAVFVFLFFYTKFNHWTPAENNTDTDSPPRHYTTWLRYSAFAIIYGLINVAFFSAILLSPDSALYLLKLAKDAGLLAFELPTPNDGSSQMAIWAALIVTAILPALPNKFNPDNFIRRKLHYRAFITKEADKTIEDLNLNYEGFKPAIDTINKTIEANDSLEEQKPFLENINSINHKWAKQCYLIYQFEHWNTWWGIKKRFEGYNSRWKEIEKTHRELLPKYQEYVQLVASRKPDDEQQNESSLFQYYESELSSLLDKQLKKLYILISVCILATKKTTQQRKNAYEYFGLHPRSTFTIPVDWDTIITTVGLVFISTLIPAMLYYSFNTSTEANSDIPIPASFTGAMGWSVISLMLMGSAVLVTIYLNRLWFKYQNPENSAHDRNMILQPSVVRRTCCAAASYFAGFVVLFLVALPETGFDGARIFQALKRIYPWPLACAVTGYFVAMYFGAVIQNEPKSDRECRRCHLKYSLSQGMASAVIGMLAALLFFNRTPTMAEAPFLAFVFTTMFIIGTGIGYIILNGYRKLRKDLSRRAHNRINVKEAVEIIDKEATLPYNITNLSLDGASINKPVDESLESPIIINFKDIGKVYARIVHRQENSTSVQFLHDKNTKDKMQYYISHKQQQAA